MKIKIFFAIMSFGLIVNCDGDPEIVTINTPTIQCGMCQKAIEVFTVFIDL